MQRCTSTHRGHGHIIAKGGDLKYMMAELYGKETGYCKGKGGSMHIADATKGILGANGIVGAGHNLAVGAGFSAQYRGTDQVCVCFFGDASTNQGTFHESMNLASIWKLPVVFVCENNGYGISMSQSKPLLKPLNAPEKVRVRPSSNAKLTVNVAISKAIPVNTNPPKSKKCG
jgi:pyruvate dehydrogenase E1 component alpha subunit